MATDADILLVIADRVRLGYVLWRSLIAFRFPQRLEEYMVASLNLFRGKPVYHESQSQEWRFLRKLDVCGQRSSCTRATRSTRLEIKVRLCTII